MLSQVVITRGMKNAVVAEVEMFAVMVEEQGVSNVMMAMFEWSRDLRSQGRV